MYSVAPFAGAWIETSFPSSGLLPAASLPSRERGLKPFTPHSRSRISPSLPSRERGLKHAFQSAFVVITTQSLPSRERGLKLRFSSSSAFASLSLPSRERGLKQITRMKLITLERVAPFAGAWIETCPKINNYNTNKVAPFAGAWIETIRQGSKRNYKVSLPSRERGLKLSFLSLYL